jgi:cystathionine beta-synthase
MHRPGKKLITAEPDQLLGEVIGSVKKLDLSQIPVLENGNPVGALYDDHLVKLLLQGRKLNDIKVREVMGEALPVVDEETTVSQLLIVFEQGKTGVMVRRTSGDWGILTKADLVAVL